MLPFLLIFLVSTSSAFTTHRYDAYHSSGHRRPSSPYFDNVFGYENIYGYRPVQVYEYAKRQNGEVTSDVYQGPVASSNGDRRRVDMPYSYQNPYQWNKQVSWNRVVVSEPAKIYNRFENTDQDSYNPDTKNRSSVGQQGKEEVPNQRKRTNDLNETQGNVSVPQISTQLDDVKRTLVINEKQITWSNDHHSSSEDNANITTRSISSANNTNSLNAPTKQNSDKINRPAKTNNRTANNNNKPNKTTDSSNKYSTKTTQDNELTARAHEQRTKAYADDKWIWTNGEDQVVTTTIQTDFDDRAAFSGDACPYGKYKIGNICVVKD